MPGIEVSQLQTPINENVGKLTSFPEAAKNFSKSSDSFLTSWLNFEV